MGPRDPMSYKAHERGEENDEHDDASLTRMFINPPLADLVSVSPPRSSLEHRTRAEMRKKENESKQKRVQNRLIGTLTIVCCFMGVVVLIRMQEFSNREESWDDMFPQTTVLLENAVSQENEDLSVFVEKLEIEERRVKHTMQKKKGYVNMHKKKGFQKSSNWSIDGPPVQLPDGVTIKSRNEKSMKVSASRRGPGQSTQPQAQRKVEYAAVESTASAKSKIIPTIHASDALQCRESVRNFVINATDGKDECDGLIKAFDKTCSNDEETPSTRRRRILHGDRRRSRRLWEKWNISFTSRLHALMYRSVQVLYDIIHYFSRFFRSSYYDADFFFAEDEVFKYFHEGLYLVDNGLDKLVQCDARRYMNKRQADLYERVDIEKQEQRRRLSSGDETLDITAPDKPKSSGGSNMLLPIKGQHASDKLVQDAFLLQQVDNIMQAINDTMNENEVAKDDAAKSKQAITDTVDVLSAVFNDPTSVEAMACCTSILNVFHELCSTDVEEQVSDTRLFFLVFVMACCGVIKSLIRYFRILWLPEAAGCILVGGK